MKLYYPQAHIKLNQFTAGKEYMLEDGTEYVGLYHSYIDGNTFTGPGPNKNVSVELIPYVDIINNPGVQEYNKFSKKKVKVTGFVAPRPYYPILTDKDYSLGFITRYFIQKSNDPNVVVEVDSEQFNSISSTPPGINSSLYVGTSVDWKLTGPLNDILNGAGDILEFGVVQTNSRLIHLKSKLLLGLKYFLTDTTELTIYSILTPFSIRKKFGGLI